MITLKTYKTGVMITGMTVALITSPALAADTKPDTDDFGTAKFANQNHPGFDDHIDSDELTAEMAIQAANIEPAAGGDEASQRVSHPVTGASDDEFESLMQHSE